MVSSRPEGPQAQVCRSVRIADDFRQSAGIEVKSLRVVERGMTYEEAAVRAKSLDNTKTTRARIMSLFLCWRCHMELLECFDKNGTLLREYLLRAVYGRAKARE